MKVTISILEQAAENTSLGMCLDSCIYVNGKCL